MYPGFVLWWCFYAFALAASASWDDPQFEPKAIRNDTRIIMGASQWRSTKIGRFVDPPELSLSRTSNTPGITLRLCNNKTMALGHLQLENVKPSGLSAAINRHRCCRNGGEPPAAS
jgi:hypothetical protein